MTPPTIAPMLLGLEVDISGLEVEVEVDDVSVVDENDESVADCIDLNVSDLSDPDDPDDEVVDVVDVIKPDKEVGEGEERLEDEEAGVRVSATVVREVEAGAGVGDIVDTVLDGVVVATASRISVMGAFAHARYE